MKIGALFVPEGVVSIKSDVFDRVSVSKVKSFEYDGFPLCNDKSNVPGLPEAKPQTDKPKQQPNKRGKFTKLDVDN